MASWTEGNDPDIASVLTHSGEYTYPKGDNPNICGGVPPECAKTVELNYKIPLDPWYNTTATRELISKVSDSYSCNHEMLVMWFNDEKATSRSGNTAYTSILSSAQGNFVVKNVDECTHVMERVNANSPNFVYGLSTPIIFEKSTYVDSGFPRIAKEPWKTKDDNYDCTKYVSGTSYDGHKIKYMPVTDTIGDGSNACVRSNLNLVELYFPDYGDITETSGKTTNKINKYAFSSNYNLSAVTFSAVKIIDKFAFSNCSGLTHIDWGNCCNGSQVTHINGYAFYNCKKLKHIDLGKLTNLEYVGDKAFYDIGVSAEDTSTPILIEIPPSVSGIGQQAFATSATDVVFKVSWPYSALTESLFGNRHFLAFGSGKKVCVPSVDVEGIPPETYKNRLNELTDSNLSIYNNTNDCSNLEP